MPKFTITLTLSDERAARYITALRKRYNSTGGIPQLAKRALREIVAMEEMNPTVKDPTKGDPTNE